jgi:hypothetical protein
MIMVMITLRLVFVVRTHITGEEIIKECIKEDYKCKYKIKNPISKLFSF